MQPLPMTTESMHAWLRGWKTTTQRMLKPVPHPRAQPAGMNAQGAWTFDDDTVCPPKFGVVGDSIWLQEPYAIISAYALTDNVHVRTPVPSSISVSVPQVVVYEADWTTPLIGVKWQTWHTMPEWAHRISLTIRDRTIHQLRDTTDAHAIDEGLRWPQDTVGEPGMMRMRYARLWDRIHGSGAWRRDAERWVEVLTFDRCPNPIEGYD